MPNWLHRILYSFSSFVNTLQNIAGKSVAWLSLAMVIGVSAVVISRSIFGFGSVATQELIAYCHAALFMLTLGYTAQAGGHVRVDIFYRQFSTRTKAWVNMLGAIVFLLPFSVFLLLSSLGMVEQSWIFMEGSNNPGGLPFVYVLKTLIPVGAGFLALYALSSICTNLLTVSCIEPCDLND